MQSALDVSGRLKTYRAAFIEDAPCEQLQQDMIRTESSEVRQRSHLRGHKRSFLVECVSCCPETAAEVARQLSRGTRYGKRAARRRRMQESRTIERSDPCSRGWYDCGPTWHVYSAQHLM